MVKLENFGFQLSSEVLPLESWLLSSDASPPLTKCLKLGVGGCCALGNTTLSAIGISWLMWAWLEILIKGVVVDGPLWSGMVTSYINIEFLKMEIEEVFGFGKASGACFWSLSSFSPGFAGCSWTWTLTWNGSPVGSPGGWVVSPSELCLANLILIFLLRLDRYYRAEDMKSESQEKKNLGKILEIWADPI